MSSPFNFSNNKGQGGTTGGGGFNFGGGSGSVFGDKNKTGNTPNSPFSGLNFNNNTNTSVGGFPNAGGTNAFNNNNAGGNKGIAPPFSTDAGKTGTPNPF